VIPVPKKRKIVTYTIDELSPKARDKAIADFRSDAFDDHDATLLTEEFQHILSEKGINNAKVNWSLGYCHGDGVCFSGNVDIPEVIGMNKLTQFAALEQIARNDELSARIHQKDSRDCHWNSMTVETELREDISSLLTREVQREMEEWEHRKTQAWEQYRREWAAVKERNLAPLREYERLKREWVRKGGAGPHDWSPRFRDPGPWPPKPLTEPYPPEPVFPRPPHLQGALDQAETRWTEIEILRTGFEKWLEEWVKHVSRELEKIGYAEIEYRQSDEAIIEFFNGNEWEFLEDGERWKR
jgi:hypothetical protein